MFLQASKVDLIVVGFWISVVMVRQFLIGIWCYGLEFVSILRFFFLNFTVPCLVFDACKCPNMWSRHGIEINATMKEVYFFKELWSAISFSSSFPAPASPTQAANGMECYSCFDRGTGDCAEGNATRVKCLGDMNQCMDFTGKLRCFSNAFGKDVKGAKNCRVQIHEIQYIYVLFTHLSERWTQISK